MKSELSFVGGALLWKVDVSYWDGIHEKLTKIEKGGKDDQFDQKAGGRRLWTSIVDVDCGRSLLLSLWVILLRDLLSGDVTFKKFCHFIMIIFGLFYF